jgi:hypothetical protein
MGAKLPLGSAEKKWPKLNASNTQDRMAADLAT